MRIRRNSLGACAGARLSGLAPARSLTSSTIEPSKVIQQKNNDEKYVNFKQQSSSNISPHSSYFKNQNSIVNNNENVSKQSDVEEYTGIPEQPAIQIQNNDNQNQYVNVPK